jgi:hypothetical protein
VLKCSERDARWTPAGHGHGPPGPRPTEQALLLQVLDMLERQSEALVAQGRQIASLEHKLGPAGSAAPRRRSRSPANLDDDVVERASAGAPPSR